MKKYIVFIALGLLPVHGKGLEKESRLSWGFT